MTGPQPRASRPVSSLLPRWPRSETSAEASTTSPQSAQTISPRMSSRVRCIDPHSGQTSSLGGATTAVAAAGAGAGWAAERAFLRAVDEREEREDEEVA